MRLIALCLCVAEYHAEKPAEPFGGYEETSCGLLVNNMRLAD